jgi:hypothetical protein
MNTEQKNQQTDNNNVRMTQINTYYGEQYKAYIELLKAVVLFSLSILILSILKSFIIIPDIILNGLMGLIIMLGIMYSLWLYYDITLRDNMNFSEYNWNFSKPPKSDNVVFDKTKDDSKMKSLSDTLGIGCIGMECCSDGMTYDSTINKCIPSENTITNNTNMVDNSTAGVTKSKIENFETYNYLYKQGANNVVVPYSSL